MIRTMTSTGLIVALLWLDMLDAQPVRPVRNDIPRAPIMFTENAGQWPGVTRFAALRAREVAEFTAGGISFHSTEGTSPDLHPLAYSWKESPSPRVSGISVTFKSPSRRMRMVVETKLACLSNFFLGNDSMRWRSGISNYATLTYKNVWPSIDIEYCERAGALEQRFILREGADVRDIHLSMEGDESFPPAMKITDCWYEDATGRHALKAEIRWSSAGSATISAQTNRDMRQVVLTTEYCSYFRLTTGNATFDNLNDVLPDSTGSIVLVGTIQNTMLFNHPYWNDDKSSKQSDIIVAKYRCGVQTPSFVTYYGGDGYDAFLSAYPTVSFICDLSEQYRYYGQSCAVSNGQIIIGGCTTSRDFPVTPGAIQSQKRISYPSRDTLNPNGFLMRLNGVGQILSSTYLGGPGFTGIGSMTLDRKGNVYIAGIVDCDSLWFISPWAEQARITNLSYGKNWIHAGFLSKLTPSCDSIIYATYYYAPTGIAYQDMFTLGPPRLIAPVPIIAVGSDEKLICAGFGSSGYTFDEYPIPVTAGMRPGAAGNKIDGFITKFNHDASAYVFSTWFGGSSDDYLHNISLDADDNILLTGNTFSSDFPLKNPVLTFPYVPNRCHGFLSKLSPAGDLLFSTYLNEDTARATTDETGGRSIALDACGNIVVLGITQSRHLVLRNPIDCELPHVGPWARSNVLSVIDPACRNLLLSTYLNDGYGGFRKLGVDAGSYVYLSGVSFLNFPLVNTYHAYQSTLVDYNRTIFTRVHIPACEPLACTLSSIDTIRWTAKRRLVTPSSFTVTTELLNDGRSGPVTITNGQLALPPGLYLDPPTQSTALPALTLGAGEKRTFTWTVRYDSSQAIMPLDDIAVAYLYQSQSNPTACPSPGNVCRVLPFVMQVDDVEPRISCSLSLPDTIRITPDGLGYAGMPKNMEMKLHNEDTKPVDVDRIVLRLPRGMGMDAAPVDDTLRNCGIVTPGQDRTFPFSVRIGLRALPRTVTVATIAYDRYGFEIARCEHVLFIPGIDRASCVITMSEPVVYYPGTGTFTPHPLIVTGTIENPLDTVQRFTNTRMDLTHAPHLALDTGETAMRSLFDISQRFRRGFTWQLKGLPLDSASTDTISMWYTRALGNGEEDCEHAVSISIVREAAECSVAATSPFVVDSAYAPDPFPMTFTLKNTGTTILRARKATIGIAGEGIEIANGVQHSLSDELPGQEQRFTWMLTARTSAYARDVIAAVIVTDSLDKEITRCETRIGLPSVVAMLACSMSSPDTLRYDRISDTYTPNPFTASLAISNHLDTAQINIETAIDLSTAPHLKLSAGEVNTKLIAVIDSHATESVLYNLEVAQRTDSPITERIAIKYRHPDDTEWKRCEKDILIEGEKRMFTASCSARGHDTIWIVAPYETIIPVPIQVQHSIANNGNVPLTLCAAAILLPAGCTLAQASDSVQSFSTILPGHSVSREWLVDVDALTALPGVRDIRWKWNCAETREDSSCTHTVRIVPNGYHGIVFTPWLLRFQAKENGTLPASQTVQLWTGTATLPWQLQAQSSWLDLQPLSGNNDEIIFVRPNTTALAPAVYNDRVHIWSVPATTAEMEVEYLIEGVTAVEGAPPNGSVVLGQNYPNPVKGVITNYELRITNAGWVAFCVRDVFGRVVISSSQSWLAAGTHRLSIDASRLTPGVYLCTVSAGGARRTRVFVVER
jgi:hypothetical protein